jgi:hypothetical protein
MQTRHFDRRSEYPLRVNYLQPENFFYFYAALRRRHTEMDAEVYKTRLAAGVPIAQIHLEEWQSMNSDDVDVIKWRYEHFFQSVRRGYTPASEQFLRENGNRVSVKWLLKNLSLEEIHQLTCRFFAQPQ